MTTKDSFEALISIVLDKINEFSKNADQPDIKIIRNELKEKFDNLAKSQGYVSDREYETLKIFAKRLEERVSKLEDLIKGPDLK